MPKIDSNVFNLKKTEENKQNEIVSKDLEFSNDELSDLNSIIQDSKISD